MSRSSASDHFQDIIDSFNQGDIHRFLSKPISNKALVDCINNLLDNKQSKNPTYSSATEDFSEILTQDPVLMQILEKAKQVASTKSNIYIYGETGTGKKTLATAIHSHSSRTDRPFVILNCATVEEDQADSALSGINRNSETTSKSRGILHRANGGTLFLDGVNHLPIAVQAKLLHILQEKSFTTDNSNKPNHFDARIISSSTTPLRAEVEKGSFKEELFYQLNVVPLQLPPLRDRIQDKELLFRYYLCHYCSLQCNPEQWMLSDSLLSWLFQYSWPGNIRELQNICAYINSSTTAGKFSVRKSALPDDVLDRKVTRSTDLNQDNTHYRRPSDITKEQLLDALKKNNYKKAQTAKQFGMSRMTLYRLLKQHNIE